MNMWRAATVLGVCVCVSVEGAARACVSYLEATQLTRIHNSRSLPINRPGVVSLLLRFSVDSDLVSVSPAIIDM